MAVTSLGCASTAALESASTRTTGHRVLEVEAAIPGTPSVGEELERVIASAVAEVSALDLGSFPSEKALALATFDAIAHSLRSNGYRHRAGTYPDSLSEILTSATRSFDCDTGSFLYVSVGDALGLPIAMVEVEVPGEPSQRGFGDHNFVRWQARNGTTIDWDPNGEHQRTGDPVSRRYGFAWTDDQLLGYVYYVRGIEWQEREEYTQAIHDYEESIRLFPASSNGWNNLAWLLATREAVQGLGRSEEAVRLAQEAVQLHPSPNQRDTLACSYALVGRFDDALRVQRALLEEEQAPAFIARLGRFERRENCLGED